MTNAIDCRRVRELMDSYLGSELTVESNHEVLRHLERCDACRAELAARERARALLIESFGPAPDARALEARISQAIDHAQPRWWRLAGYGSVAAMLALVVGLGVWFSRPVDAAAFDDSVDNHIACALTLPPDAVYDPRRVEQSLAPPYQNIVNVVDGLRCVACLREMRYVGLNVLPRDVTQRRIAEPRHQVLSRYVPMILLC